MKYRVSSKPICTVEKEASVLSVGEFHHKKKREQQATVHIVETES
jgi:hypothetical protein